MQLSRLKGLSGGKAPKLATFAQRLRQTSRALAVLVLLLSWGRLWGQGAVVVAVGAEGVEREAAGAWHPLAAGDSLAAEARVRLPKAGYLAVVQDGHPRQFRGEGVHTLAEPARTTLSPLVERHVRQGLLPSTAPVDSLPPLADAPVMPPPADAPVLLTPLPGRVFPAFAKFRWTAVADSGEVYHLHIRSPAGDLVHRELSERPSLTIDRLPLAPRDSCYRLLVGAPAPANAARLRFSRLRCLRVVSSEEQQVILRKLLRFQQELGSDSAAVNLMVMADFLAAEGLNTFAAVAYAEALTKAGNVPAYRRRYEVLLMRAAPAAATRRHWLKEAGLD